MVGVDGAGDLQRFFGGDGGAETRARDAWRGAPEERSVMIWLLNVIGNPPRAATQRAETGMILTHAAVRRNKRRRPFAPAHDCCYVSSLPVRLS